ncbi:MAG: hypothetical protein K5745_08185 [Saccharofermentans sp.]|nr:hypothetical protein [Saccharofermentans sp.]
MAEEIKEVEEKAPKAKSGVDAMSDHELLVDLVKEQRLTSKYTRIIGASCVGICLAVGISLVILVPKLVNTLNNINKTVTSAYTVAENASAMIASAQDSLEGIDTMIENVDNVVVDNTQAVTDALTNLNEIDFDTLNQSINDLHSVVEPLAKMFR